MVSIQWELALIAVVEKEVAQLEWLILNEDSADDDVGPSDIHAQISRLGGLTDLAHAEGFPLSETGAANLRLQNDKAMQLVRDRLQRQR